MTKNNKIVLVLILCFVVFCSTDLNAVDSVEYFRARRTMWKLSATFLLILASVLTYSIYKIKHKKDD